MNTRALAWFEDDDPRDILRWAVAAAVVLLIYAAAIGGYLYWHQQSDEDLGDESSAIAIELTVPEIEQQEQAKVDQPPPPQDTTTDVTLPEEKPPEKVEPTNPSPRSTARVDAASPHIDPSWQSLLFKQLQRCKTYPSGARARNEQGVVTSGLYPRPRRPRSVVANRDQLRLSRYRRRGLRHDQVRPAAAGVPGEHDASATGFFRSVSLFAALTAFARLLPFPRRAAAD